MKYRQINVILSLLKYLITQIIYFAEVRDFVNIVQLAELKVFKHSELKKALKKYF